jgi:hypothetical protein
VTIAAHAPPVSEKRKRLLGWDVFACVDQGINILLPEDIDPKGKGCDVAIERALKMFHENGLGPCLDDLLYFEFSRYEDGDEVSDG